MEKSSSEAYSHSPSQKILLPVWNPKVHYFVQNSPTLVPKLSQMNPVHNFLPSWRLVFLLSYLLRLVLRSGLLFSGFPTKFLHAFLISSLPVTCSVHLIFLHLITLITFGEESKLWDSSLCSFLHPPVTFSLLGPKILKILSICIFMLLPSYQTTCSILFTFYQLWTVLFLLFRSF